jgi:PBP1b-binding outer membrane lipoprotein LpoB
MKKIVSVLALGMLILSGCNDQESPNYKSCAEASKAGSAPLREGEAGYSLKLDRNQDGVACEK